MTQLDLAPAPQDIETVELLAFGIGSQEYCVDIMAVREIRGWSKATPLPHAPDFIRGVINLRGTVLPIIDLAQRLGLESGPTGARDVVIVIETENRMLGLLVSGVSDILPVKNSDLQPAPDLGTSQELEFISAIAVLEGRLVRVLDLARMLPKEDLAA